MTLTTTDTRVCANPGGDAPGQPRPLLDILDLARWAPSGDNTQCWRFEVVDDHRFTVHGHDTRDWCVYDLDGRASQIAIGALLETAEIAAAEHGLRCVVERRPEAPETTPTFDVRLDRAGDIRPEDLALAPYIEQRVTQRRPMARTPLTESQARQLREAVGPDYGLQLLGSEAQRRDVAGLLFRSAKIRLTIPEAYEVHRRAIAWNCHYSEDRVPDRAIGLDRLSLVLMRWVMGSWRRVRFVNRYMGGTLLPRVQLDWRPAVRCAAHVVLVAHKEPAGVDDHVAGGRAMQRLWLTATKLGLQFQPEMTPLIFARYHEAGRRFSGCDAARTLAGEVHRRFTDLVSVPASRAVFMGRLGHGDRPTSRSGRLALSDLWA